MFLNEQWLFLDLTNRFSYFTLKVFELCFCTSKCPFLHYLVFFFSHFYFPLKMKAARYLLNTSEKLLSKIELLNWTKNKNISFPLKDAQGPSVEGHRELKGVKKEVNKRRTSFTWGWKGGNAVHCQWLSCDASLKWFNFFPSSLIKKKKYIYIYRWIFTYGR